MMKMAKVVMEITQNILSKNLFLGGEDDGTNKVIQK